MTWPNDCLDTVAEVGKMDDDAVITLISTKGVLGLGDTEAVEVGDKLCHVTVELIDVVVVAAAVELFAGEELIGGVD